MRGNMEKIITNYSNHKGLLIVLAYLPKVCKNMKKYFCKTIVYTDK